MSAAEAIMAARAAGVRLEIDGDDLVLEAPGPPPDTVLDLLSRHKPDIVALLRPGRDGWTAKDWQALFDERAAVAEFDGGIARAEAEARALNYCVIEWLNCHPALSSSDRCCWCGGTEREDNVLLPFGVDADGHAWLHSACWRPWHEQRKLQAASALSAMGITPAAHFPKDFARTERRVGDEPPCAGRRGMVEEVDGVFTHFCVECGRHAPFGYGVSLRAGQLGRWYCREHRPQQEEQR